MSEYVVRKLTRIIINESFYSISSFEVLASTYFKTFSVLIANMMKTIASKKKEGAIINPTIYKTHLNSARVSFEFSMSLSKI